MENKIKYSLIVYIFLVYTHRVSACATCFGASDAEQTMGLNIAIGILLGVLGLIVLMFGSVAWGIVRNQQPIDGLVDKNQS